MASAVELAGDDADDELLLDYAAALAARARIEEAHRACTELLARPTLDPALRVRALTLLARAAFMGGVPAQAERLYEQAAGAASLLGPETEAATLMRWRPPGAGAGAATAIPPS